jgi:putative glycerol-1-phosphate prenyltransferase
MNDTYLSLIKKIKDDGPQFYLLLDPDRIAIDTLAEIIGTAIVNGVDGFLIGSSILLTDQFDEFVSTVKKLAHQTPVILFPGNSMQVSKRADAILFLSLISGRNPEYLINQQVLSAAHIRRSGLASISTAYMLIESGATTSVEFISNTKPIPSNKVDIAVAHAIAAEMIGFKMIYLEAGSGAKYAVPTDLVKAVTKAVSIPVIVGGGIRDAATAREKVEAGASMIVCGNFFEKNNYNIEELDEIASAIHGKLT